ncbi:hypothetical protein D4100_08510 [Serratia inhibens]|uniref:Uncharacterized protein n=1 Tax=Serratia inhibens TaxID=2338073 RepID=A0AA93BYL0_9GAMM|nr:hypothetical protein [Serratia inhibens]RJF58768.1 hypothetical protein D4100_08510 [Serratia inhibens]
MTTKHDNEFILTCDAIKNICYIDNSEVASSGQPYDTPPTISNEGNGRWKIIFTCGRHKTESVANSFKSTVGNTKYAMVTASSGDNTPKELNFYFGLSLSLKLPNGSLLDTLPIYLGQGSSGSTNNWWLGARALVNTSKTYLLATQSGQIAWRAKVSMSNNSMSLSPESPNTPSSIELLDVWGEGRIVEGDIITGFDNALNLNKYTQKISNGPNKNQPIPQQVMVFDYDYPQFPVSDGAVQFVTLMGAPMTTVTAQEIVRVLNPNTGVVILYDLSASDIETFEKNKGKLVYKPNEVLGIPFNEITIPNPRIYGISGVTDKIEDHDEL